jgi:hypothetical protein
MRPGRAQAAPCRRRAWPCSCAARHRVGPVLACSMTAAAGSTLAASLAAGMRLRCRRIAIAVPASSPNRLDATSPSSPLRGAPPGRTRKLRVGLASGLTKLVFEPYDDIAVFLDQLPTVSVYFDPGPRNPGPASGEGYVFFLADGFTMSMLQADIEALLTALNTDRASLEEAQDAAGPKHT